MYKSTINMRIVVDTSVIIAVLTGERHKRDLLRLTEGADIIAPSSLHWEVGNAFSSMLKKKKIALGQVSSALRAYARIAIRFYEVDLKETLDLCAKTNLFAYDAYFIACALKLRAPVLSLDKDLLAAARESGASAIEVTS